MTYLQIDKIGATAAERTPFEYMMVPGFLSPKALLEVNDDFPKMERAGNFPLEELSYGPAFASFIAELKSPPFREAVEEKFAINLDGLDYLITVRGFAQPSDGNIHTDQPSKVMTALIYLNQTWESPGGMLRLLRNSRDIEDYVAEVPPVGGTLLLFKRSDNSWHGHKPFSGERRTIQINWIDHSVANNQYRVAQVGRRVRRWLGQWA
jgi:hypothetical protein